MKARNIIEAAIIRVPSVSVCDRCFVGAGRPERRAGSGAGQRRCGRLVVPGHPTGGSVANVTEVPSEGDQVVEGIGAGQSAGVCRVLGTHLDI